jgi:hypothetical protein
LRDRVHVRTPPPGVFSGEVRAEEYLVHESLLRSHGEFPCAGDAEALAFCEEIAEEMVRLFGVSRSGAVARVNRQFSQPENPSGRIPRIWIVGLDIVYHDEQVEWAAGIYYGFEGRLWDADADADRRPLPPP